MGFRYGIAYNSLELFTSSLEVFEFVYSFRANERNRFEFVYDDAIFFTSHEELVIGYTFKQTYVAYL